MYLIQCQGQSKNRQTQPRSQVLPPTRRSVGRVGENPGNEVETNDGNTIRFNMARDEGRSRATSSLA